MCRRKNSKDLRGGKRSRLGGQSLVAELGSGRIWEMQIQNKTLVQTTLASQMWLPHPHHCSGVTLEGFSAESAVPGGRGWGTGDTEEQACALSAVLTYLLQEDLSITWRLATYHSLEDLQRIWLLHWSRQLPWALDLSGGASDSERGYRMGWAGVRHRGRQCIWDISLHNDMCICTRLLEKKADL